MGVGVELGVRAMGVVGSGVDGVSMFGMESWVGGEAGVAERVGCEVGAGEDVVSLVELEGMDDAGMLKESSSCDS